MLSVATQRMLLYIYISRPLRTIMACRYLQAILYSILLHHCCTKCDKFLFLSPTIPTQQPYSARFIVYLFVFCQRRQRRRIWSRSLKRMAIIILLVALRIQTTQGSNDNSHQDSCPNNPDDSLLPGRSS